MRLFCRQLLLIVGISNFCFSVNAQSSSSASSGMSTELCQAHYSTLFVGGFLNDLAKTQGLKSIFDGDFFSEESKVLEFESLIQKFSFTEPLTQRQIHKLVSRAYLISAGRVESFSGLFKYGYESIAEELIGRRVSEQLMREGLEKHLESKGLLKKPMWWIFQQRFKNRLAFAYTAVFNALAAQYFIPAYLPNINLLKFEHMPAHIRELIFKEGLDAAKPELLKIYGKQAQFDFVYGRLRQAHLYLMSIAGAYYAYLSYREYRDVKQPLAEAELMQSLRAMDRAAEEVETRLEEWANKDRREVVFESWRRGYIERKGHEPNAETTEIIKKRIWGH